MKNISRIILVLLLALIISVPFTGCGSDDESSPTLTTFKIKNNSGVDVMLQVNLGAWVDADFDQDGTPETFPNGTTKTITIATFMASVTVRAKYLDDTTYSEPYTASLTKGSENAYTLTAKATPAGSWISPGI